MAVEYSNKVPFLVKSENFFWKKRIITHLVSVDDDYMRILTEGIKVPQKLILEEVVDGVTIPQHLADKTKG